jgi:lipid-A-disaccharide synthase
MLELAKHTVEAQSPRPANIAFIEGNARNLMLQADAAAVASGTATLEASLMRCPTVLVYCVGAVTSLVAKTLITGVRFAGLSNIIADKEVMPELLQEKFTPEALCQHLYGYLTDIELRKQTLVNLDAVNALLGSGDAPKRTAEAILDFMSAQKDAKE